MVVDDTPSGQTTASLAAIAPVQTVSLISCRRSTAVITFAKTAAVTLSTTATAIHSVVFVLETSSAPVSTTQDPSTAAYATTRSAVHHPTVGDDGRTLKPIATPNSPFATSKCKNLSNNIPNATILTNPSTTSTDTSLATLNTVHSGGSPQGVVRNIQNNTTADGSCVVGRITHIRPFTSTEDA